MLPFFSEDHISSRGLFKSSCLPRSFVGTTWIGGVQTESQLLNVIDGPLQEFRV